MLSLIALLQKHLPLILFLFLELVCFYLIVNFNSSQKEIFLHSSALATGRVQTQTQSIRDYFSLKRENAALIRENARLLNEIIQFGARETANEIDSAFSNFDIIPARIVGQTIHTSKNTITIDKGAKDNIGPFMGLVSELGVVGIIRKSSDHFSSALSMLHSECRISAGIEGKEYFGTVVWEGRNFKIARLTGIPAHADLHVGEHIITNGFSTVFPKGIPIGEIAEISDSRKGDFLEIEVSLYNDFSKLSHVFVIRNNFATERNLLEVE